MRRSQWTDSRARHGHCRIDRRDLIKPPYDSKIQLSRQLFTDAVCPCRVLGDRHQTAVATIRSQSDIRSRRRRVARSTSKTQASRVYAARYGNCFIYWVAVREYFVGS
eukprot:8840352-Pyramimonas_sp.AAC.1